MTDLHLHTIASDGRSTPSELVDLAAGAGLTAMGVTDHDTTVSVADVHQFAERRGLGLCVRTCEPYRLRAAIDRVLDPDQRDQMVEYAVARCRRLAGPATGRLRLPLGTNQVRCSRRVRQ